MSDAYYSQELHGPFETFDLGDFELESGEKLRGLKLAYATFGTLAADKSNVVLFPSWYSGTSKILEQAYIGPGRALDPAKYFIVLVNQIGNGLSSAPSNAPSPFNGPRFPRITIADDVRAQQKFLSEKFGIEELALVLGGSMGAQQTFEWAVRFPERVKRAAPIAGTARASAHNIFLVQTFIDAIASDPAFQEGWFEPGAVHRGLRRHARAFAASGFTPRLFNEEGWRGLGFTTAEDFAIGFVENHFLPQDANNLILLAQKWQRGDVARQTGGDLAAALARIKAKTFVIAIEEDGFFPLQDILAEQRLIANSELKRVSSIWGHLALFGVEAGYNATIDTYLRELLTLPEAASQAAAA
jgi:homoserine O-acetyltransferase/O-succinyltransferase